MTLTVRMWMLVLGLCVIASSSMAKDFYVAGNKADLRDGGAGTRVDPFVSVRAALRSKRLTGGDRLVLQDGSHGTLVLNNPRFDPPLILVAEHRHQAHFDRIEINGGQGLQFHGFTVWPRQQPDKMRPLVQTNKSAKHMRFDDLDMRSRQDAPETYLSWTLEEWLGPWKMHGARLYGPDNVLANSTITGTAFAITMAGARAQALNNHVKGFSGDGIRGLGDHSVYRGNRVENCFNIDDNHDDGFQSWSRNKDAMGRKAVTGLLLEKNEIYEWTAAEPHPLRCVLQGIGMFDGYFVDPVIRDNLVATSHFHGISLYAGVHGLIESNVVVNVSGNPGKKPWIMIGEKNNGKHSSGNIVRGNLAMSYRGIPSALRLNAGIGSPFTHFADPKELNFRLKPDSKLRNLKGLRPDSWMRRGPVGVGRHTGQ